MIAFQRDVDELFAAIHRDDPAGVIEQFVSLPSASQYRKLYALANRYLAPESTVLDWGCGRGHFSYFLVKCGFRVTAFSLEHPPEIFSALSAEERARLEFVRGALEDPRALPFANGQFAAAFSVGVLEHVRELNGNELASLVELRRVLARDGVFVCYHLPNRYSYIEAGRRALSGSGAGSSRGDSAFHRYRFTRRDIDALCAQAGFSQVEVKRYGFLPRNSFNRLPRVLRESRMLTRAVDGGDALLDRLFSRFVQNYYFVARPRHEANGASRDEVA